MLEMSIKDKEIFTLRNELPQVRASQPIPVDDAMEVDDNIINNVVDIATVDVLEEIRTPVKR
jgi:hypothetical protein